MNFLRIKSENDIFFKENDFPEMKSEYFSDFIPVKAERETPFYVNENIRRQTTVECILEHIDKKITALNFANALVAGGAYVIGGNAQEESLCRASMLYYTIKGVKAFYSANRKHFSADYTDGMIYSENVPVIRDDTGRLLENPVNCNFITCPAVNRREAWLMPLRKINGIMERRIEKIVALAVSKKPDIIILGAFGCGAFGNSREDVLPMFERAVNAYGGNGEFIFAIP